MGPVLHPIIKGDAGLLHGFELRVFRHTRGRKPLLMISLIGQQPVLREEHPGLAYDIAPILLV